MVRSIDASQIVSLAIELLVSQLSCSEWRSAVHAVWRCVRRWRRGAGLARARLAHPPARSLDALFLCNWLHRTIVTSAHPLSPRLDSTRLRLSILTALVRIVMRSSTVMLLLGAVLLVSLLCVSSVSATGPAPYYPSPYANPTAPLPVGLSPVGPQYISGTIVWALLVGLLLLFVLYIGVGCILGVERPVRLSAVPLQMGKEY